MNREELLKKLLEIRAAFERQIRENPCIVLNEADLQFELFARLRAEFTGSIEIPGKKNHKISKVRAEYILGPHVRADLAILDDIALQGRSKYVGTTVNPYSYLWSLPVQAIIEIKYRGYGETGKSIGNDVNRDRERLKSIEKLKVENPLVWLVGFDQIENRFVESEISNLYPI